jgi:hypothetical protein
MLNRLKLADRLAELNTFVGKLQRKLQGLAHGMAHLNTAHQGSSLHQPSISVGQLKLVQAVQ